MNLVQRYVAEVKRHLPYRMRASVAKELRGLLDDELGALAEQKSEPLQEQEIADFLKRYGHPYRVAASYWPRRAMIGEKTYPLYRRALHAVTVWMLVFVVAMSLGRIAQNQTWGIVEIPQFIAEVWSFLLFGFVAVTLYFHYFGEQLEQRLRLWRWDPRKLPEIDVWWDEVSFLSALFAIVELVTLLGLFTITAPSYADETIRLQMDPAVAPYLPVLKWLVLASLAVWLVNLFQRYWTRVKLIIVLACGAVGALLMLRLVFAPSILDISVNLPPKDPATTTLGQLFAWWPDKPLRVIEWLSHLPYDLWPSIIPIKLVLVVFGGLMLYRTYHGVRAVTRVRMPWL